MAGIFSINPSVDPSLPIDAQPTIGLIGMGAMGKMYAKLLSNAGWKKIYVCDLPSKYQDLQREYADTPGIQVFQDGHAVSRSSDFIIYSVEAEYIGDVVKQFGPSTKLHAVVAGQTSVKAPECAAFEAHLPPDVHIVSCHSLHGPTVSPIGQPLALIHHRGPQSALTLVESILRSFQSRYVYLSYAEHDTVTANTQAVTHAAFLSMGTAWAASQTYVWEHGLYVGGLETAKVNLTLRIYSNKWHVYAGLAILNPAAKIQIDQYAKSASELFKLMLVGGTGSDEDRSKLRDRVEWGKEIVFGANSKKKWRPILLSEDVLDRFSLGKLPPSNTANGTNSLVPPESPTTTTHPPTRYRRNSHLSLLAMVDSWAHLKINPYTHLSLAATPLFRLFLGVAEHLFLNPPLLAASIHSALVDTWHRSDDLEFVVAARGWSQAVSLGSFDVYRWRFDQTREFLESRFEEGVKVGNEMIKAVTESEMERAREEQEVEEK